MLRFEPVPIDYPLPARKPTPQWDDPSLTTKGMDLRMGVGYRGLPTMTNQNSTAKTGKPVHALPVNHEGLRHYLWRDESFGGGTTTTDHNFITVNPPYIPYFGQYVVDTAVTASTHLGLY